MVLVNAQTSTLESELDELRASVKNLRIERDACWQELYEANRYGAWLSADRQALVDQLASNPHQQEVDSLRGYLAKLHEYVTYLEKMITEKEDQRFSLQLRVNDAQ